MKHAHEQDQYNFQAKMRVNTGCTVTLVSRNICHTRPVCEIQELPPRLPCNACALTVHVKDCCVGFFCWLSYHCFVLLKHA